MKGQYVISHSQQLLNTAYIHDKLILLTIITIIMRTSIKVEDLICMTIREENLSHVMKSIRPKKFQRIRKNETNTIVETRHVRSEKGLSYWQYYIIKIKEDHEPQFIIRPHTFLKI